MVKVILKTFWRILVLIIVIAFWGSIFAIFAKEIYNTSTGATTREKVEILNAINEKILAGEDPVVEMVEEMVEERIEISFSKDELNDRYIVELKFHENISENIYIDGNGEIISIEKNDNSFYYLLGNVFFAIVVAGVMLFVVCNAVWCISEYIKEYKEERKCFNLEE